MSHGVHNGPDGMLLFDGCAECEERAQDPLGGLLQLDHDRALAAWRLMRAEHWSGGGGAGREVSECEDALITALYRVAVWLERNAGLAPEQVEDWILMHKLKLEAEVRGV